VSEDGAGPEEIPEKMPRPMRVVEIVFLIPAAAGAAGAAHIALLLVVFGVSMAVGYPGSVFILMMIVTLSEGALVVLALIVGRKSIGTTARFEFTFAICMGLIALLSGICFASL
jgi:hypothetical protein